MNNAAFAAVVLMATGGLGGGTYFAAGSGVFSPFDYETASSTERAAFLEKKARSMKNAFKPNYLSKGGNYRVSSGAIQLSYNTGMGSLTCGTEVNCKVMQCKRYLKKGVSKHDIRVNLVYTDNSGRRIDSQGLNVSSCEATIRRWDAGAERRKKEKARKQKEVCSDDYIGMKPIYGC